VRLVIEEITAVLATILVCLEALAITLVQQPLTLVDATAVADKHTKALPLPRLHVDLAFVCCVFVLLDSKIVKLLQLIKVEDIGYHLIV